MPDDKPKSSWTSVSLDHSRVDRLRSRLGVVIFTCCSDLVVGRWPRWGARLSRWVRRFHGPAGGLGVVRAGSGGKEGEGGVEAGFQLAGPGPVHRDLDFPFALAADQPGGSVQQPVAQRLGSAVARVVCRHSSRIQHSRSQAIMAATHQAWLISHDVEGRCFRPVSFAQRIRSSTRAWGRRRALQEHRLPAGGVGGNQLVTPPVGLLQQAQLRPR